MLQQERRHVIAHVLQLRLVIRSEPVRDAVVRRLDGSLQLLARAILVQNFSQLLLGLHAEHTTTQAQARVLKHARPLVIRDLRRDLLVRLSLRRHRREEERSLLRLRLLLQYALHVLVHRNEVRHRRDAHVAHLAVQDAVLP